MTTYRNGDERTVMEYQLEAQRADLAALLDGLTEEEARARLVPSLTTPLGLVKHATFVEQVWFHHRIAGVPRTQLGLPDEVDDSFLLGEEDTAETVRAAYLDACARSREIASGRDLDEIYTWRSGQVSLRFVLAHLVQELARHAGHGDILVEQLVARRYA
ncbi:MAG: DinB family protein [Nocardioidaceae bacterium]|nr:DinB family protein [Nocardioidaceae bacterium]